MSGSTIRPKVGISLYFVCTKEAIILNFSSSLDTWRFCLLLRLTYADTAFIKPLGSNNAPLHIYPGHIPTLIKADMLDAALTRLVAVNSIYFKGLWKSRFQPENTKMRPFTGGNGNVYMVPMMSQLSVFNIGEWWRHLCCRHLACIKVRRIIWCRRGGFLSGTNWSVELQMVWRDIICVEGVDVNQMTDFLSIAGRPVQIMSHI